MPPKKIVQADYVKLEPAEHILLRPDSYIGSTSAERVSVWVWNAEAGQMQKSELDYNPGLLKIVDEMLTNASDHVLRQKELSVASDGTTKVHVVKNINIVIDRATNTFTVTNDGDGISTDIHPEYKVHMPELIFGNVFAGSNFDDTKQRKWGGKNGIGAKACNIFSKFFKVRTVDAHKKVLYEQTFTDNMTAKSVPVITKYTKVPFTEFTFTPDYARFGCTCLADDMYKIISKRVYDLCATTDSDVKITFNGEKIECKNFERYVDFYLGDKKECARIYKKINDDWEVALANSDVGFEQVSFVNGLSTIKGGRHVDYIMNQVTKTVTELVKKKKKLTVRPQDIKNNIFLFVKCTIGNPSFDSQTKETLTTPVAQFGSKCELPEEFIAKLLTAEFVEKLANASNAENQKALKKMDGKKNSKIRGVDKLDDANWAGTAKSDQCTLILTEGDSAASTAISGLTVVGRDKYGVFPLRGKLLNVKDVSTDKISGNKEIENLMKIMGLKSGKKYTDISELRYGRIFMMTDQDVDGSHIKGLMFNMIHTLWPSLMNVKGFMCSILTPIVKAKRGDEVVSFYNLTDYKNWSEAHPTGWQIKYYKGLGTSDSKEAREYFTSLKTVEYEWTTEQSGEMLDMAFNKKRADDRKEWLGRYDKQNVLNYSQKVVPFEEFVDKELSHFSDYNVRRSTPSICDGLKPSQRKILYCARKRNLRKEIKVAQFAGYVSEHGAYHHGEASLLETIVKMAQNYTGSNNINLLKPNGQFGTRLMGGDDSASPRYIFTELDDMSFTIFSKLDDAILTYLEDDGEQIEPEWYMPIIPMALINGASGIGTGFSTNIPCFNPADVVSRLRKMITDRQENKTTDVTLVDLVPWYHGFKGSITKDEKGNYVSRGLYTRISDTKVEITELPIGTWTTDYKQLLETILDSDQKLLKDYENHYTERDVRFVLHLHPGASETLFALDKNGYTLFENMFKLHSTKGLSITNMHLYDENGHIRLYESIDDIMRSFFEIRWKMYAKRQEHMLDAIKKELVVCDAKVRFITELIAEEITVFNVKKADVETTLSGRDYPKHDDSYDYLIRMPISSLTRERKDELMAEAAAKRATLIDLEKTTVGDMWMQDLDVFGKDYVDFMSRREDGASNDKTVGSKKRKGKN